MQSKRSRAFLVVLQVNERDKNFLKESLEELEQLVSSANIQVVGSATAKVRPPKPSHFIREGKLLEIFQASKAAKANVLIFNVDLTPAQARNLEKDTKTPVMDRTGLILDIFGKRAKSNEGKLQVELARLNYILPRLGGLGTVMSRLGGGIGTRGPGEQELEWDRRKIRKRIQRVKEDLKKVSKHRELIRSGRKRKNFITVALVGYTNAGKSTLLNAMTGAQTYVQDKLFATLDPKTRMQSINGRRDVLFVDTVGFLRDLPHSLVESFHATLEEVTYADALIHVLDISVPEKAIDYQKSVIKVLEEIGAQSVPRLLALNKADLVDESRYPDLKKIWPSGVLVSARSKRGLNALSAQLMNLIDHGKGASTELPAEISGNGQTPHE